MTTTVPTAVPQVAINDIGPTEDLFKEINKTIKYFNDGDLVTGTAIKVDRDEILLDINYKTEGVIPSRELSIKYSMDPDEEVKIGDEIEVLVLQREDREGHFLLSKKRAQCERTWDDIEKIKEADGVVTGTVIEVVKGGLILDIGLRGFLSTSLVEMRRVRDLAPYIGRQLETKIIELDKNHNNVVPSCRVSLGQTQSEVHTTFLSALQKGQVRTGVISSITNFEVFANLGGVDDLVHVSELSWKHIDHPSEVVQVSQEVTVEALDVDSSHERVSLFLKAAQEDPWQTFARTHKIGQIVPGRVIRPVPFGVFARVEDGIGGLVHVSKLATHHIEVPEQIAKIGDEISIKVTDIDLKRRHISLSLEQANEDVDVNSDDFDPSLHGMPAKYDAEGNYKYPEGFDPETNEQVEGYEGQCAAQESSYAQAQARFEAHKERVTKDLEADKEAAIAAGEAESTSYSFATEEGATHESTLADDATLAALRGKLTGDKQSRPVA